VDRLVADQAFVADLDPKGVKENQRIDRLQRPGLPGGDLLHRIRHRADQVRRHVDAVELAQMPDDLARAHAARVHRDDLVIEAGKPALVLGDKLRIEARLPVSRHLQLELAAVGRDRLPAIVVAAVARRGPSDEVMVHLGVQRTVGQRLLQLVQKAVRIKRRLRIGSGQQLVEDGIRNLRFFASRHAAYRGSFDPTMPGPTRNS
jgi:hypothetical protein